MSRSTSGVRIQRIRGEEDRVSSCAVVPADDELEEVLAAAASMVPSEAPATQLEQEADDDELPVGSDPADDEPAAEDE